MWPIFGPFLEPKSLQNRFRSGFRRALNEDSVSKLQKERAELSSGVQTGRNLGSGKGEQGRGFNYPHTPDNLSRDRVGGYYIYQRRLALIFFSRTAPIYTRKSEKPCPGFCFCLPAIGSLYTQCGITVPWDSCSLSLPDAVYMKSRIHYTFKKIR